MVIKLGLFPHLNFTSSLPVLASELLCWSMWRGLVPCLRAFCGSWEKTYFAVNSSMHSVCFWHLQDTHKTNTECKDRKSATFKPSLTKMIYCAKFNAHSLNNSPCPRLVQFLVLCSVYKLLPNACMSSLTLTFWHAYLVWMLRVEN